MAPTKKDRMAEMISTKSMTTAMVSKAATLVSKAATLVSPTSPSTISIKRSPPMYRVIMRIGLRLSQTIKENLTEQA